MQGHLPRFGFRQFPDVSLLSGEQVNAKTIRRALVKDTLAIACPTRYMPGNLRHALSMIGVESHIHHVVLER